MKCSQAGIELIKRHEGCRLRAYQDSVGVWTIGVGHTLGVYESQTISQEEADRLLAADLVSAEKCINNSIPFGLTQNQFDALCSFVFNLGCGALRNSTLLRKITEGDDIGASEEFGKWTHAGGKILNGLVARRAAEKELFLS